MFRIIRAGPGQVSPSGDFDARKNADPPASRTLSRLPGLVASSSRLLCPLA
jgi:hypothetical protein